MAELKIRIRYDSIESLLQMRDVLDLALKSGFRRCQIFQSYSNQNKVQANKLLTREVINFLQLNKFDIKFNLFKMSIGTILQQSICKIVDNLKNCPYLTTIMLSENGLTDCSIAQLCQCRLPFLTVLDLSKNNLTSNALRKLSNCHWRQLAQFSIGMNRVGNQGVHFLAKTQWRKLKSLCLESTNITNDGMKMLARGNWPKLLYLNISLNGIGNEGFRQLTRNNWKKLQYLNLKCKFNFHQHKYNKYFIWISLCCKFISSEREYLIIQASEPLPRAKTEIFCPLIGFIN